MAETKRLPGRARTHDIHPSWNGYIENFNPTDPTRSQNAFCRWSGIRPRSLSAAKRKPITVQMELKLSMWIEELVFRKDIKASIDKTIADFQKIKDDEQQ